MAVDESAVLVDGPWTHREVTAGALRIHLVEAGPPNGPLVVLLHGFPEFWWCWRHQLVDLARSGLRVVAPDLRGYGATDKPPRGYDAYTLSADVVGLVRALGARDAVLIGSDWGGLIAWTVATLHPRLVRALVVVAAPHPVRLLAALGGEPAQRRAASHLALFQLPRLPEARLVRDDGAYVGDLLRRWGGAGFPDPETERRCREAVRIPGVAHLSLEYPRWAFRSLSRPSGHRYLRLMRQGVTAPVLHLHGVADSCLLPSTARGGERFAAGGYELRLLPGVGHFPHEEEPELVTAAVLAHARA